MQSIGEGALDEAKNQGVAQLQITRHWITNHEWYNVNKIQVSQTMLHGSVANFSSSFCTVSEAIILCSAVSIDNFQTVPPCKEIIIIRLRVSKHIISQVRECATQLGFGTLFCLLH